MRVVLPASTMMVMVIKNIIATDSTPIKIKSNALLTSLKYAVILGLATGCIIAAIILYEKISTVIFIAGAIHIRNKATNPIIPIPFFKIDEQPITVSTASDKNFPIMGMKLSTANLAVLMVTPSTFTLIPYIVVMPINMVKEALIIIITT